MKSVILIVAATLAVLPAAQAADKAPDAQVMVVGMFHFSNPGHDLHNVQVDDVLLPEYQAQIARIAEALSRFKPTQIDVEWPADLARERYALYLTGKLPPSRNEVVQLGFRLAKQNGLETVHGIDVDGDFPYDPVDAYAKAHGLEPLLQAENDAIEKDVQSITAMLKSSGIGPTLRSMNDPARLNQSNSFYRTALKVGGGTEQPGADLLTAWYRRNFLICANLVQLAKPGDRIVVFYGAGHAFLLRQCVTESPGFQLVEPNDYLPQ